MWLVWSSGPRMGGSLHNRWEHSQYTTIDLSIRVTQFSFNPLTELRIMVREEA